MGRGNIETDMYDYLTTRLAEANNISQEIRNDIIEKLSQGKM
jgi:hypothetical protein